MNIIEVRKIARGDPQPVIRFTRNEIAFQYLIIAQDRFLEALHARPALVFESDVDAGMDAYACFRGIEPCAIARDYAGFLQSADPAMAGGGAEPDLFAEIGDGKARIPLKFG